VSVASRPTMTTLAPCPARLRAAASPIPLVAPVTSTLFPRMSQIMGRANNEALAPAPSMTIVRSPPARDEHAIRDGVLRQHGETEHDLPIASESGGIEHVEQVVFDESAAVARGATARAQRILQRGERTDPSCPLDDHAPDRRGELHPGDARPTKHQQPAQYDEEHEGEVHDDDQVCQDADKH